jgi:hypothetical protein
VSAVYKYKDNSIKWPRPDGYEQYIENLMVDKRSGYEAFRSRVRRRLCLRRSGYCRIAKVFLMHVSNKQTDFKDLSFQQLNNFRPIL